MTGSPGALQPIRARPFPAQASPPLEGWRTFTPCHIGQVFTTRVHDQASEFIQRHNARARPHEHEAKGDSCTDVYRDQPARNSARRGLASGKVAFVCEEQGQSHDSSMQATKLISMDLGSSVDSPASGYPVQSLSSIDCSSREGRNETYADLGPGMRLRWPAVVRTSCDGAFLSFRSAARLPYDCRC